MTEQELAAAIVRQRFELDAQAQKLRDAVRCILAQEPVTLNGVICAKQVLDVLQDIVVKKEYLL